MNLTSISFFQRENENEAPKKWKDDNETMR